MLQMKPGVIDGVTGLGHVCRTIRPGEGVWSEARDADQEKNGKEYSNPPAVGNAVANGLGNDDGTGPPEPRIGRWPHLPLNCFAVARLRPRLDRRRCSPGTGNGS